MAPKTVFSPKKKSKNPSSSSIPKVAALTPKASQVATGTSRAAQDAPIEISIMKYTSCATDVVPNWPEENLYQVQVRHQAFPAITQKIVGSMNQYLATLHASDSNMPENLSTLRSEAGILLTISSHEDNADVGLVPWRVAYYIVGTLDDLQNGINLIESFFAWRKDNVSESEKPFAKNLRLEIHATKPLADHLKSSSFTLPATLASPHSLCPFEASPPSGTRTLLFSAEFDSDGWHMSGVFLGATFQFRDRFEAQEIYGARDPDSDAYFRVLSKTNVGNEKGRVWFLNTVLTTVLRDLAMMVKLTTPPPEGSPAQEFLNLLLDQPQVSIRNST